MAILKILQYPDPRLKTKAAPVENVQDPRIQQIIADMLETLRNAENCAALAATQLDIKNPPSITVINMEEGQEPLCLINPKVTESRDTQRDVEGCMSVCPGDISAMVERAKWVKVKALNRFGKEIEIEAEDFFAKCLQHEIDHLNGMIYIDRLSPLKRQVIDKKVGKIKKQQAAS